MNDTPPKESMIFMFSKSANQKNSENIVLDGTGRAHYFTAAYRYDTISYCNWPDAKHVITLELAKGEEPKVVKLDGEPVNQEKWSDWNYTPTRA